ncbi:MAG: hypothetical protein WBK91_04140 [Alphaproteobacteria bacterium]
MFNTRAEQTTQSTGLGTLTLDPPSIGRRSMGNAAGGTGKKIYYTVEDVTRANWEEGWGIVTVGSEDTLTRNVIRSSNADQLVNFASGTKRVYCAEQADMLRFGAVGEIPTATGTANALLVGFFPPLRHYKAGQKLMWFPAAANTLAATIDFGPGSVPIRRGDGTVALSGGEMQPATLCIGVYDEGGGGRMILTNPQSVAAPALPSVEGGFLNKLRNAAMDIAARGLTGTITAGSPDYTLDGWIVSTTGANITWDQAQTPSPFAGAPYNSLKLTGVTSVSNSFVKQRIESLIAAPLAGQVVTISAWIYNNTGASITPTLTVKRPTAKDNWGATATDLNAVNLQPCANSAWTHVAYSYTAHVSSFNGLEVTIDFGGALNAGSKIVYLTAPDVRYTPGVSTGLNATPPVPELRPPSTESLLCQRYLFAFGNQGSTGVIPYKSQRVTTTLVDTLVPFPVAMREAPSLQSTAPSWPGASPSGNQINMYNNVAANYVTISGAATLSITGATATSAVLRVTAGASFSGASGDMGDFYFGSTAQVRFSAEL